MILPNAAFVKNNLKFNKYRVCRKFKEKDFARFLKKGLIFWRGCGILHLLKHTIE